MTFPAFQTPTIISPEYLHWVKAHVGNPGNEKADELDKAGASIEHTTHCASPRDITPLSFVKNILKDWMIDVWAHWWILEHPCRQTKIWFPIPDLKKSKQIMKLDRITLGRLIRWITGHVFLRRHQHIIDPWNFTDPFCRMCQLDTETPDHIITSCPRLLELENLHSVRTNNPHKNGKLGN